MRLFKPTYKDKNGKTKQVSKWWVELRDHKEVVRRFAGLRDKGQSELLGRQIQRLINYKVAGEQLDPHLSRWLEQDCPQKLRLRLADIGLLDKQKLNAGKRLIDYLGEFKKSMADSRHAGQTTARIKAIVLGCKFGTWLDVSGPCVDNYIRNMNVKPQTKSHYVQAYRQFAKWMVRQGYADNAPEINSISVPVRFERAFELDEFQNLLQSSFSGPLRYGLTGYQRYLLYRLAVETGLRRGELRSLTPAAFDFKNNTVFVKGENTKNGDDVLQNISAELSTVLQEYVTGKMPHTQLFNIRNKSAEMVQNDCEAAGIEVENNKGKIKFHSLRHTCGTFLAANGTHPKVIQEIMRHKNINLTMSRYTHTLRGQKAAAVNKMPKFNIRKKAETA